MADPYAGGYGYPNQYSTDTGEAGRGSFDFPHHVGLRSLGDPSAFYTGDLPMPELPPSVFEVTEWANQRFKDDTDGFMRDHPYSKIDRAKAHMSLATNLANGRDRALEEAPIGSIDKIGICHDLIGKHVRQAKVDAVYEYPTEQMDAEHRAMMETLVGQTLNSLDYSSSHRSDYSIPHALRPTLDSVLSTATNRLTAKDLSKYKSGKYWTVTIDEEDPSVWQFDWLGKKHIPAFTARPTSQLSEARPWTGDSSKRTSKAHGKKHRHDRKHRA